MPHLRPSRPGGLPYLRPGLHLGGRVLAAAWRLTTQSDLSGLGGCVHRHWTGGDVMGSRHQDRSHKMVAAYRRRVDLGSSECLGVVVLAHPAHGRGTISSPSHGSSVAVDSHREHAWRVPQVRVWSIATTIGRAPSPRDALQARMVVLDGHAALGRLGGSHGQVGPHDPARNRQVPCAR